MRPHKPRARVLARWRSLLLKDISFQALHRKLWSLAMSKIFSKIDKTQYTFNQSMNQSIIHQALDSIISFKDDIICTWKEAQFILFAMPEFSYLQNWANCSKFKNVPANYLLVVRGAFILSWCIRRVRKKIIDKPIPQV